MGLSSPKIPYNIERRSEAVIAATVNTKNKRMTFFIIYCSWPAYFTKADNSTKDIILIQDFALCLSDFLPLQFVLSGFAQHLASHFGK